MKTRVDTLWDITKHKHALSDRQTYKQTERHTARPKAIRNSMAKAGLKLDPVSKTTSVRFFLLILWLELGEKQINAMPRKKLCLRDLGSVEPSDGKHRAHIQCRNDLHEKCDIHGPWRCEEQRAEDDLKSMRAAGIAAEMASKTEGHRQAALDAMKRIGEQLQAPAAINHSVRAEETPTEAFLRASERDLKVEDIVVMARPTHSSTYYKSSSIGSVDADEPWQIDSDEDHDVINPAHDKPTFGLNRDTVRRLSTFKGFSAEGLIECKKLSQSFVLKRASVEQIQQLLQIMPAGCDAVLDIDTELLKTNKDNYIMLVDYRRRIYDFVSCVQIPRGKKQVVLKVIDDIWAKEVAAGEKFFECIANRKIRSNEFKGLTSGDLFIVAVKSTLRIAAVCEIAAPPSTEIEDDRVLRSRLLPELHKKLNEYLEGAISFDLLWFRKAHHPSRSIGARELINRIEADMPRQWQSLVHISGENVHARLLALVKDWPCHHK